MTTSASRPSAVPTLLLDDDVVRITRWDFTPGAETGHHVHGMGYVVVPMTPCEFLLEEPAGERRVSMAAGAAYRREAGVTHNVINGGDAPMAFIEVEYKALG